MTKNVDKKETRVTYWPTIDDYFYLVVTNGSDLVKSLLRGIEDRRDRILSNKMQSQLRVNRVELQNIKKRLKRAKISIERI